MFRSTRALALSLWVVAAVCVGSASNLFVHEAFARGRSAPPLQGVVVSVDDTTGNVVIATSATRMTPAAQVTVATDSSTVVTINGQADTVDDLATGMTVQVTPATGTATSIVARSPTSLAGVVVSVDPTTGDVVVQTTEIGRVTISLQVTVPTDSDTSVKIDGQASTVDDLTAGMTVLAVLDDGIATRIIARTPPPLVGVVVSVDETTGNVLVETAPEKAMPAAQVTVATDDNTTVTINGQADTVDDLATGMFVQVTPPTGTATSIVARSPSSVSGVVVSVDPTTGNVVVQTTATKELPAVQVTVPTNANTTVTINGQTSTVDDLAEGMTIAAALTDGIATKIFARTPPPLVGVVVSVDPATGNVVVETAAEKAAPAAQVTVPTDDNTTVTINGQADTVDDLAAGMFVQVTPPTGTATSIVARSPSSVAGVVVSVDPVTGNVVVQTAATRELPAEQVTVPTNAGTAVTINGQASTVDDLAAGMTVAAALTDGIATRISARTPPPLVGVVVSVDPTTGNVVVQAAEAWGATGQVTVPTDANTVVTINGQPSTVDNLAAGMIVQVTPPTGTATSIVARTLPSVQGVVVSVDPTTGNVVVQPPDFGPVTTPLQILVPTDSATVVTINGQTSTVDDLAAGMFVRIALVNGVATTITAFSPTAVTPSPEAVTPHSMPDR